MLSSSEASIQISPVMVPDLSHQSRRALPRDWVASRVAVREDCDLVNMFLSFDISALLWAFPPDIALHVSTGRSRIHEAHSFSGPKCFAVSARSDLSWTKNDSLIQADLYRVASSLFRIGLFLSSSTKLMGSFSRCVLTALGLCVSCCFMSLQNRTASCV